MSATPDRDKALEALTEIVFGCNLDTTLMRERLVDKLALRELQQRAEEAERCAKLKDGWEFAQRAADLRRQAGGVK